MVEEAPMEPGKQFEIIKVTPREWQLRLYGSFCLLDPFGNKAPFPNRKVEGLLAVLALHPQYGIERDAAAEILWPGKTIEFQRTSFRQALSTLRKIIGEDRIESTRSHCRLRASFQFQSDCDDASLRSDSCFMPGHEGEWFEEMRLSTEPEETFASVDQISPLASFSNTLIWLAGHDANAFFNILQASKSLTRGIAPADLLSALKTVAPSPQNEGWRAFWRGAYEDDLTVCASLLEFALREARQSRDYDLGSWTCFELGKAYARLGRVADAQRIVKMAFSVSEAAKTREARANAVRLSGNVLIHWGDVKEGLAQLTQAEDQIEDSTERAISMANRAFFAASAGLDSQAESLLLLPQKVQLTSGHRRLQLLCSITEAILEARGSGIKQMQSKFASLSATYYNRNSVQFGVYADEMLAKSLHAIGERSLASTRIQAAAFGRRLSQMVRTDLESSLIERIG